jgi:hypothetical protein
MEQGQDEQAVVLRGQREMGGHDARHGLGVRVVEHDALGPAGGPARVDQQGEVVGPQRHGRDRDAGRRGPHVVDLDRRAAAGGRPVVQVQHQNGARVLDLVVCLVGGEYRVDRGGGPAEAPRGEERHRELHPVGQHDREDVATSEPVLGELLGEGGDPVVELAVGQVDAVVAHARVTGGGRGPLP